MDLETENRLAALLMREAAELRRQSEREGVLAYLRKPNVRHRPNSRFLTATVRGVQQANRAVEVNEMWRLRQKELELDKRVKEKSIDKSSRDRSHRNENPSRGTGRHAGSSTRTSDSCSSKREYEVDKRVKDTSKDKSNGDRSHRAGNSSRSPGRHAVVVDKSSSAYTSCSSEREYEHGVEGLKDEELEEFLHSRTKRGRGAVGPRMDETGPYLPHSDGEPSTSPVRERHIIYGPERPLSLRSNDSSSEEELHEERRKKSKKSHSRSSDKDNSKKRRSKDKSKHKKKKREEKKSKHHH
ncbi:arginine/serine-rich protein PNISR [Cajanus cajan]|uniref:arginine/serine-rich protein PNISR n=1 Tax=Cajanus cajan TaxID=3821 RepID=UPI00098D9EAA|nr:arginine/serine-rich protein PNISR [Cajanus cajan]XP_020234004.1 arginine/serine-rich protein PNISR [Cajanus cajan]